MAPAGEAGGGLGRAPLAHLGRWPVSTGGERCPGGGGGGGGGGGCGGNLYHPEGACLPLSLNLFSCGGGGCGGNSNVMSSSMMGPGIKKQNLEGIMFKKAKLGKKP